MAGPGHLTKNGLLTRIRSSIFRIAVVIGLLVLPCHHFVEAQGPVFSSCPQDRVVTLFVGETQTTVTWTEPEVNGDATVTTNRRPGDVFMLGETIVTYRAVDEAGIETLCEFKITITAPTIFGCPDRRLVYDSEQGRNDAAVTWVEPAVADPIPSSSLTSDYESGDRFLIGQTVVTYTLSDDGPNNVTCQFTVVIRDVEDPSFTSCPEDIQTRVLSSRSCNQTFSWPVPVATDNAGQPTVTSNYVPGLSFGCGKTNVTYEATDATGNKDYCRFIISVQVGAYQNCPDNITGVTIPGDLSGNVTWTRPTISDRQPDWTEIVSHTPHEPFVSGTTNVTYILADPSGDTEICWFLVTILDIEDPVLVCPPDVTVTASGPDGNAEVFWTRPTPSDNVQTLTLRSNYELGDTFPTGDTLVTYTAEDSSGNSATCNFTITVQDYAFSAFTQIMDLVFIGNDDKVFDVSDTASCLNACLQESTFVCRSAEVTGAGQCRLSSSVARTDADLQPENGATYFEKLGDNTPPLLFNCPRDITRDADEDQRSTIISWLTPVAIDEGGGPVTIQSTRQSGETFNIGDTRVTYTATDQFLNSATCSFIITIKDVQQPEILDCPNGATGYIHTPRTHTEVSWMLPRARDNSGMVTLSATHQPGSLFPIGNSFVTYTASDPSGNEVTCSITVTVVIFPESHRFLIRLSLPGLAFSDGLLDTESNQYQTLAQSVINQIDEAFRLDVRYLDSAVINISMSDNGGVFLTASIGFIERVTPASRRNELQSLLTLLESNGVGGVMVEKVEVPQQGVVINIDECFTLPCPDAMNCTVRDDTCVSFCPDNPTYCLNGASCYKHSSANLVACVCADYTYYGDRCELQDTINEPRLLAGIIGGVWGIICLLLLVFCIVIVVHKWRHSSNDHQDSELMKPDVFNGFLDDNDDEDPLFTPDKTKSTEPSLGKSNPAFVSDDCAPSNGESGLGSVANGSQLNTESAGSKSSSHISDDDDNHESIKLNVITDIEGPPQFDDGSAESQTSDVQPFTALVHRSEDGNFVIRGRVDEERVRSERLSDDLLSVEEPTTLTRGHSQLSITDTDDGMF